MTDPEQLLDKLVAALKTNSSLVTLLGGSSSNIVGRKPTYPTITDTLTDIRAMNPPSILVAYTGTQCNDRINGIEHFYSIFLQPSGGVIPVFYAIREGSVTTDEVSGQALKLSPLTSKTHPPDVRGCQIRQIYIGDVIVEYWEVPIRITDRGLDN